MWAVGEDRTTATASIDETDSRPAAAPRSATDGGRWHVLVVEDDAPIREMLTDLLEDAGYTVRTAANGMQALDLLRQGHPDLVVLDLMLPSMSGWEFLDRSREQLQRLNVRVMIVSAIQGKSDYPSSLGVAAWFTKPLDVPRFLGAVERLAGAPGASSPSTAPQPRVLVIEDEVTVRNLLQEQLAEEGFAPDLAGSVEEARARIQRQAPDLILLDLMLPGEDGWSFLQARSTDAVLGGIPVVAISAAAHHRLLEAKQLGADAFLSKPFDLDALTALVRSFVG